MAEPIAAGSAKPMVASPREISMSLGRSASKKATTASMCTPASTVTRVPAGMVAWTDAHNFVDLGGSQAVVFGPGHLRNAHREDEWVDIEKQSSVRAAQVALTVILAAAQ